MPTSSSEVAHMDARAVEEELARIAEVRQNPPARADIREQLPQANGDQDTW